MVEKSKEPGKGPQDHFKKRRFRGFKRPARKISHQKDGNVKHDNKVHPHHEPARFMERRDNIKNGEVVKNLPKPQEKAEAPTKKARGSRYAAKTRRRMIPSITHLRDDVVENIKPRKMMRDYVKVIPVGGVEEIGRNMIAVEFGDDIIVMDAGIEFPTSAHPGVDYLIPNVSYLKKYKHLIRGIVISHGHLDHVGALPYVIEDLGNPPIYTTEFTAALIRKKHSEFKHLPTPNIVLVKKGDRMKIGKEGMLRPHFLHR
ncbi:MBL fold metallo-hydrolase [Candidatus Azambacteria bacterium]|nr:MBL fold metallo-hydrolase [Candidatus Azambacteria bacterium]